MMNPLMAVALAATLAAGDIRLERWVDHPPYVAQRVSYVELWTPKEEARWYPQSAVVIETDWSEGATMFGTHTTFLDWDNEQGYRKFEVATNMHNNGESGGHNTACWWWPSDVDDDTADEPVFLKASVGAAFVVGPENEEGWSFSPIDERTSVFYLDTEGTDDIVRREVSGEQAIALLEKRLPTETHDLTHDDRMRMLWTRFALARARNEAKQTQEAVKALEGLRGELAMQVYPPEEMPKRFQPTPLRGWRDEPERDEINVYNPVMLLLSVEEALRELKQRD